MTVPQFSSDVSRPTLVGPDGSSSRWGRSERVTRVPRCEIDSRCQRATLVECSRRGHAELHGIR